MRRIALLAVLALACVSTLLPTPADRDAAITREDFSDWLSDHALETKRESLTKSARGGIVILEYGWLGDDAELAVGLQSMVYWTRTPAEAAAAYRSMLAGAGRGRGGVFFRPALVSSGWAEDAKAYLLVGADRHPVGNLFVGRRGNVAVMAMLTGLYAEEPRLFTKKLEPELWKLSRHAPS